MTSIKLPKEFYFMRNMAKRKKNYPEIHQHITVQLSIRVRQIVRSKRVDLFLMNSYSFWQLENARRLGFFADENCHKRPKLVR